MGAFIFKQPNGLYGRWSSVVDDFTAVNMTEAEYKISNIDRCIRDSEDTLKHRLYDFDKAVEETNDMLACYKSAIQYGETEMERTEAEKHYKRMKESYENDLALMREKVPSNDVETKYYNTLCELIEHLCCAYDKNWNKKRYTILEHPEHMEMILPKLQEIVKMVKSYGKGNKIK